MSAVDITNYYAALNELAALLQDRCIGIEDWNNQRRMMYYAWHGVDV